MSSNTNCQNCDAPLQGPFCSQCGQAASHHLDLRGFVHDATHEFLHLDGKIVHSLKLLLFKPGALTLEFLAGRRARYITPLRLYLTFSVIFFALAALFPSSTKGIIQDGVTDKERSRVSSPLDSPVPSAPQPVDKQEERAAAEIGGAVQKNLPRAMFVLMPLFALLSWILFRRQQRHYVAHLYYSIHFHAFLFTLLCVQVLLGAAGLKPLGPVLLMAVVPYHFLALRRVFTPSLAALAIKGTTLGVVYVFISMTLIVIYAISVVAA